MLGNFNSLFHFSFHVGSDEQHNPYKHVDKMVITLENGSVPLNLEQLEMNSRIHPRLDELGTETVVWAIQDYIACEEYGQDAPPLDAPKPIRKKIIPEEQVVYLLEHALGFPEEERAEKLANIIRRILEDEESCRVYRPVFLDYLDMNQSREQDFDY